MKDQVQQLHERGIKSACIVSGLTATEQEIIFNQCIHGKIKILYVSPERLKQRVFIEHFRQMKISFIAVDEAHCISQWGYDFRPPYLEIARIRIYHNNVPVIALTATATPRVVTDIQHQLLFRPGHKLYQSSFSRPNLAYMVFREGDKEGRLLRIAHHAGGSGIVYVRNRRRTGQVAQFLANNGITATYYHAGLSAKERDIAQLRWIKGETTVMVATNAFGMGIDKPDVRFVVHLDIPSSIEAYFQEAGRAGRDGQKAYAVMLYDENDIESLHTTHELNYPTPKFIASVYKAICNYYQLPIGSGEDCQFAFDIEQLCSTYNFNPVAFYNAARFLEREGLIAIPDREETESRVHIPVSRDDIYRFQMSQDKRYSDLLSLMLRMYGGFFSDFVPISERAMARRLDLTEKKVTDMLHHMDALKIIYYKSKTTKPQIIFTAPRVNVESLTLTESDYNTLKQHATERLEAMLHYVDSTQCRSSYLLQYFGEQSMQPCGICDHCIQSHHSTSQPAARNDIRTAILQHLQQQPLRVDELLEKITGVEESTLVDTLRTLVDERAVSINQSLQFFV
ncbi:MAG: RecQ family ATP-dependent DNA helicase [Bacteroidales bacterium]|nr:RecQ family ATP-dependent DNA helicase [Bacteroidales bacterium]